MHRILRLGLLGLAISVAAAAQVNPALFSGLHWRLLGPWRGGKTTAVVGSPLNPSTFYTGGDTSGVWKTTDAGRTWRNVSDSARLTGIAALAMSPNGTLWIAVDRSGGSAGAEGLYALAAGSSTPVLATLRGHPVFDVWLDPRNGQHLLAASNAGIVRSQNGGRDWTTVLNDAAVDLESAPDAPATVYAAQGARHFGDRPVHRSLYRSLDAGAHWTAVAGKGLPPSGTGRIGLAVAPGTHGRRLYAYMAQGVFRSDDGGASWHLASSDPRLVGGGQFFHIYVDPSDANVLYVMQTSVYRSTDAGASWTAFTGAPSGDDFNALWIDPSNPLHMALAVDQGTEVSLNGGRSWSTWYNQPTGQMYNVSTDHQFPFHLYASQQDSGTVVVPIRANDGQITYRDWFTTNGFESARITPDPLHPDLIYATGWYGSVIRTNRVTGQSVHVFERNPKYREAGSMPMVFLPSAPNTLLLGTQYVLASTDGGMHWRPISPDLTAGHGAITAIAPSPARASTLWAGTSGGHVQLTIDNGSNWNDVTPLRAHGRVRMIEADPQKADAAFVVYSSGIYVTNDNGSSWSLVSSGMPGQPSAIRVDKDAPDLLFASSDAGVFVSFDRGAHWQSLELNLPASAVTDLQIESDDLLISTYGRGLWALDDIASLRQMSASIASQAVHLFRPSTAIRLQWDDYTDTPLNPDEPHSQNPPDGAIVDYFLQSPAAGAMTLQILDNHGTIVNSYSDQGPRRPPYKINVPEAWLAPPQLLPNHAGLNRFVWNLRYPDPPHILFTYFGLQRDYFEYTLADHAIEHNTPWHEPQGPMVLPGAYKVVLTVNGRSYSQPLMVRLDPRLSGVTSAGLEQQLALAQSLTAGLPLTVRAYEVAAAVLRQQPENEGVRKLQTTFGHLDLRQARLLSGVTQADAAPGEEVAATVYGLCQQYNQAVQEWNSLDAEPKLARQDCVEGGINRN